METLRGRVAVVTGAASGIGLALATRLADEGTRLVLADIEPQALERTAATLRGRGAEVLAQPTDVAVAAQVQALADAAWARFGAVHLLCNNAGVTTPGLVVPGWLSSLADWQWVLSVNLMGVVHGVRCFVPMMLEAARADPSWRGHVVNTASMAGMVNPPNMGVYNVSKHAVVSLSESLYHDLSLVTDQVHAHVLCPFFVATGIHASHRNRPAELSEADSRPTPSQIIAQAMTEKATQSGKVTAAQVAQALFDAMAENRFYVFSHPNALGGVQSRMEDVLMRRNPSDPYADRPDVRAKLQQALRG